MCNSEAPLAGYKKTLSSLAARGRETEGQAQDLIISVKDPGEGGITIPAGWLHNIQDPDWSPESWDGDIQVNSLGNLEVPLTLGP